MEQYVHPLMPVFIIIIIILAVWDAIWKFIALWKSARNNHLAWFICIAVINTIGILPIIYILMHRNTAGTINEDVERRNFQ